MLTAAAWIALFGAVIFGAALAALAPAQSRRAAGLLVFVLALGGLLLLLGADLAALAWLGFGALLALGPRAGEARDADPGTSPRGRWAAVALAGGVGATLIAAVWSIDWREPPLAPPVAGAAEVGGALLTQDLALLGGVGLLMTAVLVAAAWMTGRARRGREGA